MKKISKELQELKDLVDSLVPKEEEFKLGNGVWEQLTAAQTYKYHTISEKDFKSIIFDSLYSKEI